MRHKTSKALRLESKVSIVYLIRINQKSIQGLDFRVFGKNKPDLIDLHWKCD